MMKANGKTHIVRHLVIAAVLAIIWAAVMVVAVSNVATWNLVLTITTPLIVGAGAVYVMTWNDKIRTTMEALKADLSLQAETLRKDVRLQLDEVRARLETLPTKEALKADLLTRQGDRFDSLRRDGIRHKAALAIGRRENLKDTEDVLDFFDDVGGYLRRELLDEGLVSDHYSYWVVRYHSLIPQDYIEQRRDEEHCSEYWENFDWLDTRMRELNPEERGHYPDDKCKEFLKDEGVTDDELKETT